MRYCFDLDGTLCTLEVDGMVEGIEKDILQYTDAKPIQERIDFVNKLLPFSLCNAVNLFFFNSSYPASGIISLRCGKLLF